MGETIIAQFEHLPYGYISNFMDSQLERLCSTTEFSLSDHRILDNSWSHDDRQKAPTKIINAVGLYRGYYNGTNRFEIRIYDLENGGSGRYKSGLYVYSSSLSLKGQTMRLVKSSIDELREKDSIISIDQKMGNLGFR